MATCRNVRHNRPGELMPSVSDEVEMVSTDELDVAEDNASGIPKKSPVWCQTLHHFGYPTTEE